MNDHAHIYIYQQENSGSSEFVVLHQIQERKILVSNGKETKNLI